MSAPARWTLIPIGAALAWWGLDALFHLAGLYG